MTVGGGVVVGHLFRVAREGGGELVEHAALDAALELRSVEEVLVLVPAAEEEPPVALGLVLRLCRQQQLPARDAKAEQLVSE